MTNTSFVRNSLAAVGLAALVSTQSPGATVPSGFQDALLVDRLDQPTALAFAPDGRLFVAEKATGRIRVVEDGELLPDPFLDLTQVIPPPAYLDSYYERGVLGIAFDPAFATTPFVYVYYTVCKVPGASACETAVNRVVRVLAEGDVADPSSHTVLLDDLGSTAGNHNAGWIDFGPVDGKLYVAVGDGAAPDRAQDLGSLNGKVLRLEEDGSIPADNPYVGRPGVRGEIFASGFRNPWRCRFHPDGTLFCADVGQDTWEELDVVVAGGNYGWPTTEGPFDRAAFPQFVHPIHWYGHDGARASITGGDFGARTSFPGDYREGYFFGDFIRGWIKRAVLDGDGSVARVEDFVTGIGGNSVTDIVAGPDGSLYYTTFAGTVRTISAVGANRAPVAHAAATPTRGLPPLGVRFSSAGSRDPDGDPITFSWDFGDGSAGSAEASPEHVYTASGSYRARLTVSDGQPEPGPARATVTVRVGRPPRIEISAPVDGDVHRAGDTIDLVGRAIDPDEGELPPSALHWQVVFYHDTHTHPFIDDLVGSPQSFVWATGGEPDPDVHYEVRLRAIDSTGLAASRSVRVVPLLGSFTLATDPPGLRLTLDGQPVTSPHTVTGVVGFERTIGASSPQEQGQRRVRFLDWSDGGDRTHLISTPAAATVYTASFGDACGAALVIPPEGGTFAGTTEGDSTFSADCAPSDRAPEQVFAWTPAVSGQASIHTCGPATDYDTIVSFVGGTCQGGIHLACNDDTVRCSTRSGPNHGSRLAPVVSAGQPYFIVVDGYVSRRGRFALTVVPPAPPSLPPTTTTTLPPEGTCGSPLVVPPEGGTLTGATAGTGSELGSCGSSGDSGERVFAWTPVRSGIARIHTCGADTGYDSVLYVRGGACDETAEAACNDDTGGCPTAEPSDHHGSSLILSVTAGETYFIAVDGYGGRTGPFALTVVPPAGTCASALTIPAEGGVVTGRTAGTSRHEGSCGATGASPEVVFRWTPGRSGNATLQTCGEGTGYDTVVYLRRGECEDGPELACNDDSCSIAGNDHWGSRITPTVTAGETYFVVVDGFSGRSGVFSLSVVPPS